MNRNQGNPVALETELAEAIDHFFETAQRHDFEGSEMVTHLGTTQVACRTILGTRRVKEREGLVNSLTYLLWEANWNQSRYGMRLAVEGVFIQVPYVSYEWPEAITRPRATRELIDVVHSVARRIGS